MISCSSHKLLTSSDGVKRAEVTPDGSKLKDYLRPSGRTSGGVSSGELSHLNMLIMRYYVKNER